MKRRLLTLARALLSVALVAVIVLSLDGDAIVAAMRRLAPGALVAAALLVAWQGVIIGWRWHRIVSHLGGRLAPRDAVNWVFVGIFFNSALPTSVGGDAVRIWLLRRSGESLGLSLVSVVIERGTGIALLGLMVSACVPAVWASLHNPGLRWTLVCIGPVLLVGLVIAAIVGKATAGLLPCKLSDALRGLGEALGRLTLRPYALAEVVILGLAASLTGLLAAYVIGESLGMDFGLLTYIVLVGGSMLMSVLPISLGGWGVRELSMVALFGALGGMAEQALALSLLVGLLPMLVSLPAGLLWQRGIGKRARSLAEIETGASGTAPGQDPKPLS